MDKKQLRAWAKEERKKLDIKILSEIIVAKLRVSDLYKDAKHVMLYYPLDCEINLMPLLEDSSKTFYLPKICGENIECAPYSPGDTLLESKFKTLEPITESVDANVPDLIIVPALCADKQKYRLGYGGGFYDRFLAGIKCPKVVCLSSKMLVDTISPEEFDIKVDYIITD